MQQVTEIEEFFKEIEKNPNHWIRLKKDLLVGMLWVWDQKSLTAEKIAEKISQDMVDVLKKEKYEITNETLKNIFKNSILLQKKDIAFFQSMLTGINPIPQVTKDFLARKMKCNADALKTVLNNSTLEKEFLDKLNKNKEKLERWADLELYRQTGAYVNKAKSTGIKALGDYFNKDGKIHKANFAIGMFFFCFTYVAYILAGNAEFVANINSMLVGSMAFFAKTYYDKWEQSAEDEKKACEAIKLELKKEYPKQSKQSKQRRDFSYDNTSTRSSEQTHFLLVMMPVSYLPPPPKAVEEEVPANKPLTYKGRHKNKPKPDTRSLEKRAEENKSALTPTPASCVGELPQESTALEEKKLKLTPGDFGYPNLKPKYLVYIQGAGFFIFDKYKIREQAYKQRHREQYKDLKHTFLDKTSQRQARDEGQSGNLKLNNDAGYEFKTMHGKCRALFINEEKNIAKTEKGKFAQVYKAKIYNEYSPEGLHRKKN